MKFVVRNHENGGFCINTQTLNNPTLELDPGCTYSFGLNLQNTTFALFHANGEKVVDGLMYMDPFNWSFAIEKNEDANRGHSYGTLYWTVPYDAKDYYYGNVFEKGRICINIDEDLDANSKDQKTI